MISALYTAFAEGPEIKLQDRHLEAAFSVEKAGGPACPAGAPAGQPGRFPRVLATVDVRDVMTQRAARKAWTRSRFRRAR